MSTVIDKNALVFKRGDSYRRTVTVTDSGSPVDVTGCTAVLTVSTVENPTDDTTKLFSVSGELDTDPATGQLHFTPTASNNGVAGEYFYDVQITDSSGNIRTPIKSTYTIAQDISK